MASPATNTFQDVEHVWIAMPDGIRLAARLWLPDHAEAEPVPAIFEIIPYRKGDMVRARDERNHPYFAAHGYACLRVDMRGSGDSEGLMGDMYEPDELSDTRHVIDWIAGQSWCNGSVGMFGTSWGGTASLQASVDAPEALKAVIAVCATHDRYEDDIHHMGGCLLTDSIEWGATFPAILASPPAAATVGPAWREMWQERLDNLAFPLEAWVREEARGAYWRWGSVKFDTDRFTCPILAVGGWSDRYSNSVMSLVEARPDKVWGIVGPWGHHYPDVGHPGPGMNFQKVALDWWDHWLRAPAPAEPDWARLRVWLREFDPPGDVLDRRNGQWIESGGALSPHKFSLADGALVQSAERAKGPVEVAVPLDLRVGQGAGDTGYFGRFGGLPLDQGSDDGHCLVYESEELTEDLILFGAAEFASQVRAGAEATQLSIRISDVSPEGEVCRVAMAVRNLALDPMLDERPGAVPGTDEIQIRFPNMAYRFKTGHRIRLAIGASYWPLVWPGPQAADIRLLEGSAELMLPSDPGRPLQDAAALPAPSPPAENAGYTTLVAPNLQRTSNVQEDGAIVSSWHQPKVRVRHHDTNSTFGFETRSDNTIFPDDPLSAHSRYAHELEYERPDGTARVHSVAEVRCDLDHFHLSGEVRVFWNDEEIFVRTWAPSLKRRCS